MPTIHPTACVDSAAELAPDVIIGPRCVVEGPVVVGAGSKLIGSVYLSGKVVLGRRNVLYPFACLGLPPQDRKYPPDKLGAGVVLGDDNVLREGVTIHRATGEHPTRAGDRNYLMVNAHLGHDVVLGNDCTLANGTLMAGHVELQNNVVIGGNSCVHQFCRIGRLCMISGSVGLTQDVPPFCTVYRFRQLGSLNLVGLRRSGLRQHIRPLQTAFNHLFRRRRAIEHGAELAQREVGDDPLVAEMLEFIRRSRRGITPFRGKPQSLAGIEAEV